MNDPVDASVVAGDVETQYRRHGQGDVVVLLAMAPWESAGREALGRWARVIVPTATSTTGPMPAPGESGFSAWLHGFLEGLGLEAVVLVAARTLAEEIRTYQRQYPEQVLRVVWIDPAPTDWAAVAAAVRNAG